MDLNPFNCPVGIGRVVRESQAQVCQTHVLPHVPRQRRHCEGWQLHFYPRTVEGRHNRPSLKQIWVVADLQKPAGSLNSRSQLIAARHYKTVSSRDP